MKSKFWYVKIDGNGYYVKTKKPIGWHAAFRRVVRVNNFYSITVFTKPFLEYDSLYFEKW